MINQPSVQSTSGYLERNPCGTRFSHAPNSTCCVLIDLHDSVLSYVKLPSMSLFSCTIGNAGKDWFYKIILDPQRFTC